ncbi:hypothetical protein BKA70DRAFT_174751 [Coprinopsis sp. MPI-PUGE-AT-0042]|nr:hypothetical protein BKA70DRAFT_174751 [Coprinopsis sp. MPI-PUGE-AT-0042]
MWVGALWEAIPHPRLQTRPVCRSLSRMPAQDPPSHFNRHLQLYSCRAPARGTLNASPPSKPRAVNQNHLGSKDSASSRTRSHIDPRSPLNRRPDLSPDFQSGHDARLPTMDGRSINGTGTALRREHRQTSPVPEMPAYNLYCLLSTFEVLPPPSSYTRMSILHQRLSYCGLGPDTAQPRPRDRSVYEPEARLAWGHPTTRPPPTTYRWSPSHLVSPLHMSTPYHRNWNFTRPPHSFLTSKLKLGTEYGYAQYAVGEASQLSWGGRRGVCDEGEMTTNHLHHFVL